VLLGNSSAKRAPWALPNITVSVMRQRPVSGIGRTGCTAVERALVVPQAAAAGDGGDAAADVLARAEGDRPSDVSLEAGRPVNTPQPTYGRRVADAIATVTGMILLACERRRHNRRQPRRTSRRLIACWNGGPAAAVSTPLRELPDPGRKN
jgi:hypothetical protein